MFILVTCAYAYVTAGLHTCLMRHKHKHKKIEKIPFFMQELGMYDGSRLALCSWGNVIFQPMIQERINEKLSAIDLRPCGVVGGRAGIE